MSGETSVRIDCSTKSHPNLYILVDADDAKWVVSRKWTPASNGGGQVYLVSTKARRKIVLHREIARARFYEHVDHKNGDTLDNRKSNLRTCTRQQNTWNQTAHTKSNSRYKGVHCVGGRFKSYITKDGTTFNLGTFDTPEKAAIVRDSAALWLHGEFAYLNFPDAGTVPNEPRPPVSYRTRRGGR